MQEHFTFFEFIFVYQVEAVEYRVVLTVKKLTKEINVISEPREITTKLAIKVETTITESGRVNLVSNTIEEIITVDSSVVKVLEKTRSEVYLDQTNIVEVKVNQTSFGAVYVFTTKTEEGVSDVTVIYNQKLDRIKVIDIEECEFPIVVRPAPRPAVVMTEQEIVSEEFEVIVSEVLQQSEVISFTTQEITTVKKTDTTFGVNYQVVVETPKGISNLTIHKPLDGRPQIIALEQPQ